MYLPRTEVERTLHRLRGLCASGSCLAFDVWRPDAGAFGVRGIVALGRVGLAVVGEPVRFGLPAAAVADFVRGVGLEPESVEVPSAGAWSGLTVVVARPAHGLTA
jgi:O-methyltransferase involved in polyketide biosynthesis